MLILLISVVILAYLLGSINFAVIFVNLFLKKDIRSLGSKNAGTTNVMRNVGFLPGLLTFVFDALKGFIACFLGNIAFNYAFTNGFDWAYPIYGAYICGLACMLGHVFPIFFKFKGGKGVATSVGIFAVCCPIAIIAGLIVFAFTLIINRLVSFSSLFATVFVVVFSLIFYDGAGAPIILPAILCVMMGIIVFLKHSSNIKRLIKGEEDKIKIGGKKNG